MFCYTLKSITVDQIEKEREKESEFWATQPKEVCIKKANDDAKHEKEYAEKNGIRTMGISSNRTKILIEK